MAKQTQEVITPTDLDGLPDGTAYKRMSTTEQSKLTGIEDNAKDDQTGAEVQTAIEGLTDANRTIMISDPQTSEFKIHGVHRNAAGNLEYDYDDVAV